MHLLPLLLFVEALTRAQAAIVIGIDFGTDSIKVGLRSPGPLSDPIRYNRASKRKTPAIVAIDQGKRILEDGAMAVLTKNPNQAFPALKNLLGRLYNDSRVLEYRNHFHNTPIEDPMRGTVRFAINETLSYSVEELVAAQLDHIQQIAKGDTISALDGAVITVPHYFNQFERQAILDAAEIAGLKVFSLVNDGIAVAVTYIKGRLREITNDPQYHIIYDVGAGSTVASVVSFQTAEYLEKGKNNTYPELKVVAVGADRFIGGHDFDVVITSILIKKFKELNGDKIKTPVEENANAMSKFALEAVKVKESMVKTEQIRIHIDTIHDGLDFHTTISRDILEEATAHLIKKAAQPVHDAIKAAGIEVSAVKSMILHGGGTRLRKLQEALVEILGDESKIGNFVNTDEAATVGATYLAALHVASTINKSMVIKIKDVTINPVSVRYHYSDENGPSDREQVLFKEMSSTGSSKKLRSARPVDYSLDLFYGPMSAEAAADFGPTALATVAITDTQRIIQKYSDKSISDGPHVRIAVRLDENGCVQFDDATMTLEYEEASGSLTAKVKNFFGSGSDSEAKQNETQTNDTVASNDTKVDSITVKGDKSKSVEHLVFNVTWNSIAPLSAEEKLEGQELLKRMEQAEQAQVIYDSAKNELEANIYKAKEYWSSSSRTDSVEQSAIDEIMKATEAAEEWLDELPVDASLDTIKEKLAEVKDIGKDAYEHVNSREELQSAFVTTKRRLKTSMASIGKFTNKTAKEFSAYIQETEQYDLGNLTTSVNDTLHWLEEEAQKFANLPKKQLLETKAQAVQARVTRVERKVTDTMDRLKWSWKGAQTAAQKAAFEAKAAATEAAAKAKKAAESLLNTTTETNDTAQENSSTETGQVEIEPSDESNVTNNEEDADVEAEAETEEDEAHKDL